MKYMYCVQLVQLTKGKNSALSTDSPQNNGIISRGRKVFTFLLNGIVHPIQSVNISIFRIRAWSNDIHFKSILSHESLITT